MDDKEGVTKLLGDFEKAFDIPPHKLLTCKLFSYGICGKARRILFRSFESDL